MTTKKPVADPDIEPEYDFGNSVRNPYAERYREDHVLVVTGPGLPSGHAAGPRARSARVRGATLIVSLVDGREVRVPVRWLPRLRRPSRGDRLAQRPETFVLQRVVSSAGHAEGETISPCACVLSSAGPST